MTVHRRAMWLRAAAVTATVLLIGCGSTVDTGERVNASPVDSGLHASDSSTMSALPRRGETPTNVAAVEGAAHRSTPAVSTAPGGTAEAPTGAASAAAPGVTDTTIAFGVAFTRSQGAENEALGAGGQDQGDVRRYYDILAEEINDRGGVLGRELRPVYFDLDSSSGESVPTVAQEICEYFTKDHPVFVVFGLPDDLIRSCVQDAGALLVASGGNSTSMTFQQFPNYFETTSPRLERAATATIDGLIETDYFQRARNAVIESEPLIGLVTWDEPSYRRSVEHGYLPALGERHLELTESAYVNVPYSDADLSTMSAAVSNAILKFRQAGITHVFVQDGPAGGCAGACLTLLWLKGAGSQSYYPRYGFNDSNSAWAGYEAGLWTAADVDDSRYVTWNDGDPKADEGVETNAARESCLELMRSGGITVTNATQNSAVLEACDVMRFTEAALRAGPGTVDAAGMIAGVNALDESFAPAANYRARFSPEQHDGTAAYRVQGFNDGRWTWLSGLVGMR